MSVTCFLNYFEVAKVEKLSLPLLVFTSIEGTLPDLLLNVTEVAEMLGLTCHELWVIRSASFVADMQMNSRRTSWSTSECWL